MRTAARDASLDRMHELSDLIARELRKETHPLARGHSITGLILNLLDEHTGTPDQMCDAVISALWLALLHHPDRRREGDNADTLTSIDELMTNVIQRHTAAIRAAEAERARLYGESMADDAERDTG